MFKDELTENGSLLIYKYLMLWSLVNFDLVINASHIFLKYPNLILLVCFHIHYHIVSMGTNDGILRLRCTNTLQKLLSFNINYVNKSSTYCDYNFNLWSHQFLYRNVISSSMVLMWTKQIRKLAELNVKKFGGTRTFIHTVLQHIRICNIQQSRRSWYN